MTQARNRFREEQRDLVRSSHLLAGLHILTSRLPDAIPLYRATINDKNEEFPIDVPLRIHALHNLAFVLSEIEKVKGREKQPIDVDAMDIDEDPSHPSASTEGIFSCRIQVPNFNKVPIF